MPELPEVEAVCRRVRERAEGAIIVGARVYRCAPPGVADLVPGRAIEAVERRAKHILLRLSGGLTLAVHLRMSGNLSVIADERLHTHTARVVLALNGGSGLVLEDPRALARLRAADTMEIDAELARLAPEPLSAAFSLAYFTNQARASRQEVKVFLMDQRRVAGLGNIYAAEVLFRARIHPRRPVARLTAERLRRLHRAIVRVLRTAVESAYLSYGDPGGFAEGEHFPVAVYDREGLPCLRCRRAIRRIPQGGRSTYFCLNCQR